MMVVPASSPTMAMASPTTPPVVMVLGAGTQPKQEKVEPYWRRKTNDLKQEIEKKMSVVERKLDEIAAAALHQGNATGQAKPDQADVYMCADRDPFTTPEWKRAMEEALKRAQKESVKQIPTTVPIQAVEMVQQIEGGDIAEEEVDNEDSERMSDRDL
ncbi:unnamed protein product [Heligmosomoides polygyrus]|uniref:PRP21_like_P domain-containing protein n=1 Tax=Heligmosomoides polygyrus TaxID=6339 RepID=A0A183G701_HELPZ|nr:unnamed protein product [Heligmosomoides polygyrus]